jgi:hypothetical protein
MSTWRYRSEANREAREMDRDPGPTRGEPGEFRADCRKSARILTEFRAFKAGVVRDREAGTWPPARSRPVRSRRVGKGASPFGSTGRN